MDAKRQKRQDPKLEALRKQGSLNPRPEDVTDPAFRDDDFFDPRDLVQVKYEMMRRVRSEGHTVTEATKAFGFSRPSFYLAKRALENEGLPGLVPKKRGPRAGHKVTPEVLKLIHEEREKKPSIRIQELLKLVENRFGLNVHRRTVERAVLRSKKKRR